MPMSRDEIASRGAAMVAEKGWNDAVQGGFDMADDCIEVASWFDVGTNVEPEFNHDTEQWEWYAIDYCDGGIQLIETIHWHEC
jgi:hypothetical protein